MKTFKENYQIVITMITFGALLLIVSACGDDDEEPSSDHLLVGSWQLIREDGDVVNYLLIVTFEANGNYSETVTESGSSETDTGTWRDLGNNRVRITYGPNDSEDFTILTLTQGNLVALDEDGYEYEFIKLE